MDIDTARERLIEHERLRPGPGQFSALWEQGRSWQQAFDELVGAERARDTLFEQLVDAAQGLEARRERLQQWLRGLKESLEWYGQRRSFLAKHQRQWNVDEHGQSLAPNNLFAHQAAIELRAIACNIRRTLVELEFLEYRRRAYYGLDEDEWQSAFADFQQTLRAQTSCYWQWHGADLPEYQYAERLRWSERVLGIQQVTLDAWSDRGDVDVAALQADLSMLDRLIDPWRPRPIREGNSLPALLGIGLVIALIVVFASSGSPGVTKNSPTSIAQRSTASPTIVQAAAIPIGDLNTLNEEGKQLLQQGRWVEAIQLFQAAFDADPTTHDAYEPLNNMAFCLYELGRPNEAIAKWQQALSIEPNSPDANAGLGMALYQAGRQEEAISYYQTARRLKPEYGDEQWLRDEALWSERVIADSRALRELSTP